MGNKGASQPISRGIFNNNGRRKKKKKFDWDKSSDVGEEEMQEFDEEGERGK